jgi:hypothetical protein
MVAARQSVKHFQRQGISAMTIPIEQQGEYDAAAFIPSRRIKLRSLMWGVALGVALGLGGISLALVWWARESTPVLTRQRLAEAQRRWASHGPSSYELDLVLGGSQTGAIHVAVRNGEVVEMTRDGRAPRQRRTWDYWSVPNQFAMLSQDLESAQSPERVFGVRSPGQVLLRAEFDPRYGYPAFYQRTVLGGTNHIEWRITRFEALP